MINDDIEVGESKMFEPIVDPTPTFIDDEERLRSIRRFAEDLVALFQSSRSTEEKRFFEFFGIEKNDIKIIVENVNAFERTQAIYGVNTFIRKYCKGFVLENYDGSKLPPTFEFTEIRRKEFELLVSVGYYFIIWKNKKFIIDLYFCGNSRYYRIWFKNEDEDSAKELKENIVNFCKKFNLFKGEKLLFLQEGTLDYLEYPKLDWKDVILSNELKEELMLNIIFPLENEELCKKSGIPWRRGVLCGGKAGTGKTQACRVLCNVVPKDVTVLWATPKSLYNEHSIQSLFDAARFYAPTLIILEDIDFIGLNRDFSRNPILGELLTQLDGNDPNDGIFVITTTNRPELLDEALANRPSRFDISCVFELPNPEQRQRIIELFSKDMEFAEPLNMPQIIEVTKDLSGSHIKEIFVHCQLAALKAKRKPTNKDIIAKAENYKKNLIKNGKEMVR